MATFMIPGDAITSVSSLGASAPETGYYKAKVTGVVKHPTRATSRKMEILVENGFSTFSWLNSPYDENGNLQPGLQDRQVRGMLGAIKSVFESAGYTNDQMAQGVTDEWLVGKDVYLEWHSAKDLGAQYGEIAGYLRPATFEGFKASGTKPAIAQASAPSKAAARPAARSAAPVRAAAPAPVSAPVPGGISLPPPPSSVVN